MSETIRSAHCRSQLGLLLPAILAALVATVYLSRNIIREVLTGGSAPENSESTIESQAHPFEVVPMASGTLTLRTDEAAWLHSQALPSVNRGLGLSDSLHVLRLYGPDSKMQLPGENVTATLLEVLTNDRLAKLYFGTSVFMENADGLQVISRKWNSRGESHRDQTLAAFAEAGVSLDQPVRFADRLHFVRDVLRASISDFHLGQRELEWTAVAYALYLPPKRTWINRFREPFSFDDVASELMNRPLQKNSCGGSHLLFALTILYRVNREIPILSAHRESQIRKRLDAALAVAMANQHDTGYWSPQWSTELLRTEPRDWSTPDSRQPTDEVTLARMRSRRWCCGANALYILLRLRGIGTPYGEIERHLPERRAVSLTELQEASSEAGVELTAVSCTFDELHELGLPLIMHFRGGRDGDGRMGHYVVAADLERDRIRIIDGTTGRMYWSPRDKFNVFWTRRISVVAVGRWILSDAELYLIYEGRMCAKRLFLVSVCSLVLLSEGTGSAVELSAEVSRALDANASAINPARVVWEMRRTSNYDIASLLRQIGYPPVERNFLDPVRVTFVWQDKMVYFHSRYTVVELSEQGKFIGVAPAEKEYAFNLRNLYMGTGTELAKESGESSMLIIDPLEKKVAKSPTQQVMEPQYFAEAGIRLPVTPAELGKPARSMVLYLIDKGAAVTAIESMSLDGHEHMKVTLSDSARQYDFYLDPDLNYCVRRRDELAPSGELLSTSELSEFSEFRSGCWLPKNCLITYYSWLRRRGPPSKKPLVRETITVLEMSHDRVPTETFTLVYNLPGTHIADGTMASQENGKRVNYKIPADPSQLDEVIQAAKEGRRFYPRASKVWPRVFFFVTGVTASIVIGWLLWRTYFKSSATR